MRLFDGSVDFNVALFCTSSFEWRLSETRTTDSSTRFKRRVRRQDDRVEASCIAHIRSRRSDGNQTNAATTSVTLTRAEDRTTKKRLFVSRVNASARGSTRYSIATLRSGEPCEPDATRSQKPDTRNKTHETAKAHDTPVYSACHQSSQTDCSQNRRMTLPTSKEKFILICGKAHTCIRGPRCSGMTCATLQRSRHQ